MTEEENYKERLEYLIGRIETLEQILRVTISTLSPEQRDFIYDASREYERKRREIAESKNNDRDRDRADAAWEYSESIRAAIDDWGAHWDEIKNGTWQEP